MRLKTRLGLLGACLLPLNEEALSRAAERELVIHSDAGSPVGSCDLGATLNRPEHAVALVVFVHGSGNQNRNESLPNGIAPFKDIAEALSAQNIASLRYDKRSSIKACLPAMADPSNPQRAHPELRPEHFIRDIEEVYRRAQSEAGGIPIYLLGHSEGVNYVLELAAQKRLEPAGVILLAGLGRYPIDVTLLRQMRQYLLQIEEALRDQELNTAQRRELERLRQETKGLLRDGEIFFEKIRSGRANMEDYYSGTNYRYWKEWLDITDRASATAAKAGKRSLLIQGSLDLNVTKDDFDALAAALKPEGGTSLYLKDLNHFFLKPTSSQVDASVPESISAWIHGQLAGTFYKKQAESSAAFKQLNHWTAPLPLQGF